MTDKQQKDSYNYFIRRTKREVLIWDWLSRILPLTALAVIILLHFGGHSNALDIALTVTSISFLVICFIWWYWVLSKILTAMSHISDSEHKFKTILQDIKNFKNDLDSNKKI